MGGIDHKGRVFLGLALLHRYRNARAGNRIEPMLGLLSERERKDAEVLGKAMRFGAMFSVAAPELMGSLRYRPKRRELELRLSPAAADLFGEVAAARFDSLVDALQVEKIVKYRRK
jgi:exopolyphosphatase/guanosine-5'-triphosphate,3'-diphosphate pyrophosphatase